MKTIPSSTLLVTLLLTATVTGFADSPPPNIIPIISMKTGQDVTCTDITMDVVLMLLWHNFDGIWVEGKFTDYLEDPAVYCDSAKAVMVVAPGPLQGLNNWPPTRWGRYTTHSITSDSAFIHPDTADFKLIDSCSPASSIISDINSRAGGLYNDVAGYDCIWYYDIFNEGPARQLKNMLDDTSTVDDYFPSFFTQDTNMTQVLPDGIFAWEKWKSDSLYRGTDGPLVSTCHSMLHNLPDSIWAGIHPGFYLGTENTQSNSVNAYFDMQYLRYSPSSMTYDTLSNTPTRLDLNAYPIRCAGYTWQTETADSITTLGSATDLWMLEHYELYMDSTFIPAGDHEDGPFPIHYHPQAVGRSGGRVIWHVSDEEPPDTLLQYTSYSYRRPSPAEFRMLCNIGLLRGAKAVMPYSLRSNTSGFGIPEYPHAHTAGLLDENLIPFDAPYEDWVYRDRPTADFFYAPPDTIPPWIAADGSQFDPLYTVPGRPSTNTTDPKFMEDYLEWKFDSYGRLWDSVKGTFREIAWVAPELSGLWWWFSGDRYDNASITYDSVLIPLHFANPHVRVFTDSTESTCYLFYVNRFCRANNSPFKVAVNAATFPDSILFSEYALDHSRRCLIPGDSTGIVYYSFLDTLNAGQARLLEMFDDGEGLAADLRITDPDIFVIIPADGDTLTDNASTVGTGFDVYAWVYNMGTEAARNVSVTLEDAVADTVCETVTVNISGLSTDSCYRTARALVSFSTVTPTTSDIGVHVYRVRAAAISNEPDTLDNSATLVYMVRPGDYATEVLDDPWDMNEASSSPPAWKTFDIDSLTGCWGSYTDSISGMFEGNLSNNTTDNSLYLNIGSGRDDWIDADKYHNFSLAGRSKTPVDIVVHWMNSDSSSFSADIQEDLKAVAADIGPVGLFSLNSNWTGDIVKFWLEFTGTNISTNVRIGWVKLTE